MTVLCDRCKYLIVRNNELYCRKFRITFKHGYHMKSVSEGRGCYDNIP